MNKTEYTIKYIKTILQFTIRKKFLQRNKVAVELWKKKFLLLLKAGDDRYDDLLREFLYCKIEKISHNKVQRKNPYSPILFCVIKNDIKKIKEFMAHYRRLGIECFVFLDNLSNDGTREYLCRQKDAIVYSGEQEYSSVRRVAWLNRLLAIYGENRWCIVVDSDELLTYIDCEKYLISDVIKRAVESHYYRIEGFMLDMYSQDKLFVKDEKEAYIKQYRYFDANSYIVQGTPKGVKISGGPRKRLFKMDLQLSKYPLFYFRNEDFLASSHYLMPVEPVKKCPIWFAICHYKFVDDDDLKKIDEAVKKENYSSGSAEYKKYLSVIQNENSLSFYQEGITCEMENSNSLRKISFLKSVF